MPRTSEFGECDRCLVDAEVFRDAELMVCAPCKKYLYKKFMEDVWLIEKEERRKRGR